MTPVVVLYCVANAKMDAIPVKRGLGLIWETDSSLTNAWIKIWNDGCKRNDEQLQVLASHTPILRIQWRIGWLWPQYFRSVFRQLQFSSYSRAKLYLGFSEERENCQFEGFNCKSNIRWINNQPASMLLVKWVKINLWGAIVTILSPRGLFDGHVRQA
jgi:hypothetical protein